MSTELILRRQELIENPTARVPILLVLDASPSMADGGGFIGPTPIDALNDGVRQFFQEVCDDEVARYAAEVAMVSFSSHTRIEMDFGHLDRVPPTIEIHAGGGTSLGVGISKGLELLDSRKEEYKETGVDYYQPWLVLMTDGEPTDDSHHIAAREIQRRIAGKVLSVFPIGVGAMADMQTLALFSRPGRPPLRLKGLAFREFFEWLGKSVAATSRSTPGETVRLDLDGIRGWGEV